MGEAAQADPSLIPDAWGLANPYWHLKEGALDYDADYQLIHDNLLDLTHLDYLHEKTLGAATGGRWSDQYAAVTSIPNGVHVWRWLRNAKPTYAQTEIDSHTSYRFLLPGLFLQHVKLFPAGTAEQHPDGNDLPEPLFERVDQQAVTPVAPGRSRYFYAAGLGAKYGDASVAARLYDALQETFMQDKTMIEAQGKVLARFAGTRRMSYIPQDRAPTMFRKLVEERLLAESKS
jgi:vanillate O-demethylase monooxygenase subunit